MNEDDRRQPQDQEPEETKSEETEESDDEQKERVYDLGDPRPEPGITAPLDHVTGEEAKSGPAGMMPGAGPDPDDVQQSGVEGQDAWEDQKEEAGSGEGNDGGKEQER